MEAFIEKKENIDGICDRLRKDQICIIQNFINLEDEFDQIIRDNNNTRVLRKDMDELKKYKKTYSVFTSDFVKEISMKIMGKVDYDKVFIHQDRKVATTNNVNPHFDYDRKLKFYICANDMNLDNGCFKILPGKKDLVNEKRSLNRRKNVFTPGHKLYNGTEIKISDMIPVIAKAGDLVIFDTNCIHCGGDRFKDGKERKVIRLHINMY